MESLTPSTLQAIFKPTSNLSFLGRNPSRDLNGKYVVCDPAFITALNPHWKEIREAFGSIRPDGENPKWDVDFVRPQASFDMSGWQDPTAIDTYKPTASQRAATHFTNFQPSWNQDGNSVWTFEVDGKAIHIIAGLDQETLKGIFVADAYEVIETSSGMVCVADASFETNSNLLPEYRCEIEATGTLEPVEGSFLLESGGTKIFFDADREDKQDL